MSALQNTYLGLRHGQSQANVENRIVSSASNGMKDYGLTQTGVQQVWQELCNNPLNKNLAVDNLRIYASDFLRTQQTSAVVERFLQASNHPFYSHSHAYRLTCSKPDLRERFFGDLDMSHDPYQPIWDLDILDPSHQQYNVESVEQVATRIQNLLQVCEQQANHTILWVAHGDVLSIAQAVLSQLPLSQHHTNSADWTTGQLRMLGGHIQ